MNNLKLKIKNSKLRYFLLLFTVHCSLFTVFSCGYTLQTKKSLPFDSISIGAIVNKTYEPKLEDRFNRALAEVFSEYGFTIAPSSRYALEGEITAFELKPLAERLLVATQYEVAIKANLRLKDRETGKVIPLMPESPFIAYFTATGRLENILAQKELASTSALRDLSQEVVRQIIYKTKL